MAEWTVKGMDRVLAVLHGVRKEAAPAVARALHEGMQIAFLQSQKEVPVRTGVLKNSGQLEAPQIDGLTVRVAIVYGGAASSYAQIQHDDVTLSHRDGQKAHYVIDPVRAALPDMRARVAAALKEAL